jgi:hypothetical protein
MDVKLGLSYQRNSIDGGVWEQGSKDNIET